MQRVTMSIDEPLAIDFDRYMGSKGYKSRSEAIRDLVRNAVETWRADQPGATHSVATLSFVHDRRIRVLAQRLSELRHAHHDLIVAATLMHLDHNHTLESILLRGETAAIRNFVDRLQVERGIGFAMINLIGVDPHDDHEQSAIHSHSGHHHLSPTL